MPVLSNPKEILRAGDIPSTGEAIQRLEAIAEYSIWMAHYRAYPRRQKPKQPRPKPGDPPRARPVRKRGAPPNKAMREVFGNLAGFWLDFTDCVPGVSFYGMTGEVGGRFVRFSQSFCENLAIGIERLEPPPPGHEKFLRLLRETKTNPIRVRTWLRAIGLPQFVTKISR